MDFKSFGQVEELTLKEYYLLMKSYALKRVDREYEIHLQAYLNQSAKAQKKSGRGTKSVYKNFNDFFDYKKRIEEVTGERKRKISRENEILITQANSL